MKIINTLLLHLCATVLMYAQQPASAAIQQPAPCRTSVRRIIKPARTTPPPAQPSVDFYVGEARVDVTKDQTVVRLAMAQHGSVLIELPANDGPRYIIPGDPEMATVDQKALERNKRAIIVRPGNQFLPPIRNAKSRTPAATVTAQMRSGLVVTFLFYPVEDLAQNVHRCVLTYNRDEVIARRRAVGLPVNLDKETRGELTVQSAAPASISVENDQQTESLKQPVIENSSGSSVEPKSASNYILDDIKFPILPPPTLTAVTDSVAAAVQEALKGAINNPGQFTIWTKPVHGLSLSTIQPPTDSEASKLLVIAIRNRSSGALQLTDGGPELLVEMVDDQGKAVNIEQVNGLHKEGSVEGPALIRAGETIYYSIAYAVPVLGVNQQIRVVVAQTKAADEPASFIIAKSEK
jgi:hypothetical protein